MAIQLSPELEARVQKIMDTGHYDSVDEVLHTALDTPPDELPIDLSNPDVVAKLKTMVAVADEDIAAGRVSELNIDEFISETEKHLDERGFPQ